MTSFLNFHFGVSLPRETGLAVRVPLLGKTYPKKEKTDSPCDQLLNIGDALELKASLRDVEQTIAKATQERYLKIFNQICSSGSVKIMSKSRLRLVSASILFGLRRLLVHAHTSDTQTILSIASDIRCLERLSVDREMPVIATSDVHGGLAGFLEARGINVEKYEMGMFPKRVGRVNRLKGLPNDWREQILGGLAGSNSTFIQAVTFLSALGCRPCELAKARVISLEDDTLLLTVQSAKSLGGDMPVTRGAVFPCHPNLLGLLPIATAPDIVDFTFAKISTKQVENLLRRTSHKIFPRTLPPLSASAFRNQQASDLKKSGVSAIDIALFLGHKTTRQQKKYGRKRFGQIASSWCPTQILPSHEVRLIESRYPTSDVQGEVDWNHSSDDDQYRYAD